MNSGYAINPARDFPPRVFTWLVYGGEVWTVADNWGWSEYGTVLMVDKSTKLLVAVVFIMPK